MMQRITKSLFRHMRGTQSIGAAALIVAAAGIISRILGLIRDRILASSFGAGDTLDVYNAAFRVPDLLFELFVLGALGAAFIPVFTSLISKEERDRAWQCASGVMMLLLGIISFLALLGIIFAPIVVHLIAPGFPLEKSELTVQLTRIMFIGPLFLCISAVCGGILISFKRFLIYSLAPIVYNVGIIIGALFFVPLWGPIGLAWGVVLGAFLHMVSHLPALMHPDNRGRRQTFFVWRNPDVRHVVRLMLPRMFGSASNQFSLLVITIFTSLLASGSLTVFTFAHNIQSVVLGLIGVPFALAAFPALSSYFAREEMESFDALMHTTVRRILFYVIPLSFLVVVLREQIVRVIYGGGAFDWTDTVLTFQVLGVLALSLFAQSLIPLLARVFYAMHNTIVPFYAAIIAQVINVTLVLFLIRTLGVYAIAIGFSVAAIVNVFVLAIFLQRTHSALAYKEIGKTTVFIMLGASFAAMVAHFATQVFGALAGNIDTFIEVFFQLVFALGLGIASYLLVSYALRLDEIYTLRDKFIIRIFGRVSVAAEEQNEAVK